MLYQLKKVIPAEVKGYYKGSKMININHTLCGKERARFKYFPENMVTGKLATYLQFFFLCGTNKHKS